MTTTSPNPACVLWRKPKKALLYTPKFEAYCHIELQIAHDTTTNEGSIFFRFSALLANLGGRSETLTLHVSPEIVEKCTLVRKSTMADFPLCDFSLVSGAPTSVSQISTLSLSLHPPGTLLCPLELESEALSPANPNDPEFAGFSKICAATDLRVYLSKRQFANDDFDRFQNFFNALQRKGLKAKIYNHNRKNVVKRNWHAFAQSLDPPPYDPPPYTLPPYCELPVFKQADQKAGKRHRDPLSEPPDSEREKRKRVHSPSVQASYYTTEDDSQRTVSTSPSPSIQPTDFTRAPSSGGKGREPERLENGLRDLSGEQTHKSLIQSEHRRLPATLDDAASDLPYETGKVEVQVQVEDIERRLQDYIEQAVGDAVIDCCDQIFHHNEIEFGDRSEKWELDLGIVADDLDDLKKEMEEHRDESKDQAQQDQDELQAQRHQFELQAQRHQHELQAQAQRHQHESQAQAQRHQHELQAQAQRHQHELQAQAQRHQYELQAQAQQLADGG
ncbi:hypothetical protein N7494_013161 [Penicillium frequentans]|uniref:Uncharacterized protein n=1 Tax=Penicillium frequentans TaxID=3151616 RepID=A0AAD6CHJ4_9EURO|nr:hypothetical protein N7494_013161 [Penicillium glabrum]